MPLPRNTVESMVRDSFQKDTSIRTMKQLWGGYFSLVYDLTLENPGINTILKISPPSDAIILRCEKDLLHNELSINRFLTEKTSVPVPEIITSNFRRNILERDYIFFRKLQGMPLNKAKRKLSKKEYENIKNQLGGYLAGIHSIRGTYFGSFADSKNNCHENWKDTFLRIVREIIDDAIELKARLPDSPQAILKMFEQNAHCLEDVTEPRLVYADLWEGNVFISEKEGAWHIEGIIDCDRAFWGDPCYDFVSSIALFKDIKREQAFLKGYSSRSGQVNFTPRMQQRLYLYQAYYDLQVIVERRSRQYQMVFSFLLWCYVYRHLKGIIKKINNSRV
ncbi:MAG: aminoglycoside phosphotransferase family protein [Thiotrichales bacterium]|nr:aminoglycoside phosphotransferase family protein [Thiotrichales bacterium]